MSKQDKLDFIQALLPHALKFQKESGVPASLAIAQALLESGGNLEAKTLFGIKARAGQAGFDASTKEYINGKMQTVSQKFVSFGSVGAAFDGLRDLYISKERYQDLQGASGHDAAYYVKRAGYATDKNYSQKLIDLMDTYNLTQYDDVTASHYKQTQEYLRTSAAKGKDGPMSFDEFMQDFPRNMFGLMIAAVISSFSDSKIAGVGTIVQQANHNSITPPSVPGKASGAIRTT